ncbi:hypothetical protein AKJ45_00575 [candidate division MSBL1 archaeon SCGC-AAA261F19]|uniref:Phosphoglucosamine mutase n=2 Tax=candidate division MSBL1 TaxID=215777 RepID=A0A133VBE7_9EURY|nr:hypothetical protein AKJ43_02795 [candidate division MSBL1 archaeon SCGC-AAA261D19]KXB03735.1 hypothetical protein AKJ45_00575 [candidate division MSBL1 archaeon SCGC-AAA261F19]
MSNLFGTSGVRGIYLEKVSPDLVFNLGRALATHLDNSGKVAVGRDPRTSSVVLEGYFSAGLISCGCNVKKLGLVPTPAVSFAAREFGTDAGAMITASHNPPEYNGIKFFNSDGMAYTPAMEAEIERIYSRGIFEPTPWDGVGNVETAGILEEYINKISDMIKLDRKFKVAVDCGNGATSAVTPYLLRRLGCEVVAINSQPDGTFPGHPPEPVAENLRDLCEVVRSVKADLGLAHDGDGDRVLAVDEMGRVVPGDELLASMGAYAVKNFGGVVVTTVDASKVVDEQVTSADGKVVRTRVGDVSVAQKMKTVGAKFGGEPSGALIWGGVHLCPDGPLIGAKILEMVAEMNKPLSKIKDEIPHYPVVRSKIACPNKEKPKVMEVVKERFPSRFEGVSEVLSMDGLRLEFEDGSWVLIRPSGTEPYIRITAEADNQEKAELLVDNVKKILPR